MVNSAERSLSWLVVNTHAHRERLAVENLDRQSFEAYCPQLQKILRTRGVPRVVLRPLFPGYIFVRADPEDKKLWRPILSTYGVRQLVRLGENCPSSIDPRFIAALRTREVEGAVVRPPSPYQVGQDIRIAGGPFDGLVATILQIDDKERLVVLMDLLGQAVRSRIHSHQVRPAGVN